MPASLIAFLQNNRNMMEADLFVIVLPTGQTMYATSGQWDVTVPEGAGGWSGPTTTFKATEYGRWSRGTITSEATFNMSSNTMPLTCVPQPATAYPDMEIGVLNAALNGLFDAAQVTVYTAYFPMGQYGTLAGASAAPPPSFVLAQAASASAPFGSPAQTSGIDTGNASIDLIVVACNNYDGNPSEGALTDTINGVASGNVWTLVPPDPSVGGGVSSLPFFYYCYAPNTGVDHVFTFTSSGNACPNLCMMAFTGMGATGAPEADEGYYSVGGNQGPLPSSLPTSGSGWQYPLSENDLILSACGVYGIMGLSPAVDSGLTVAGHSFPFTEAGIAAAYAIAAQGTVACTGDVDITGDSTAQIAVASTTPFVAQQTCSGQVILTANTAAISVPDSTGFTAGMLVIMNGFTGGGGAGELNDLFGNVISAGADVITVAIPPPAVTPGTYTGQSGTVSQAVALAGYTGLAASLNSSIAIVTAVGSGNITITTTGLTNGTYTGQTAGIVGLPVNPFWSGWGTTPLANNAAAGMVIFPAGSGGSGPGGIETKFTGTITRIADINRVHVEFEVADPLYALNMRVPRRLLQPNCPWSVTDQNCTLDAAGTDVNGFEMTQAFTLASGTAYLLFPVTPFVQPEGYFTQGVVTCTAGNNAGLSQTVKVHVDGELQLLNPWLLPVEPGDTFSVLVGCDHTPATCNTKFGNFLNFGGAPFVPPSETAV